MSLKQYPMRSVEPHVCATCKYHSFHGNGYWQCARNGKSFDTGDRQDIERTCAGWKSFAAWLAAHPEVT